MRPSMRTTPNLLATLLVGLAIFASGCKSKSTQPETPAAQPQAPAAQPQAPAAQPLTQMSLDDLVAPIALYPDQLLSQMLITSVNSQEVLDLGNWLIENQSIKTDAAPAAAKQAGFSTSAQYLAAFPQVVDNMCQEMDWTKQLGQAYQSDPKGVMDAIQRKRAQAEQQGNLKSSPQMAVDTKTDNGKQVVEIKPADPQVIYVPQYNAQTVYTEPAPAAPAQTTVVEQQSGVSTGAAVGIGLLSFGLGMAVGSALSHDNYYPYPSWGYGGMYYGGRPYYPPPYRAPVYAGYRPAYAYRPPANYRWNQYNRNVNVNVNNNNYYGRYRNNNNRLQTAGNTGYLGARNVNNRPGEVGGRGGTSGYLGARPEARNERPGGSMASVNPNVANRGVANRPNAGEASRPTGSASRPGGAAPGAFNNRAANTPANAGGGRSASSGGGDRGFGNSNAGASQNRAAMENRGGGGGAFGGGNSGGSDRAASSRGHASMGASAPQRGGGRHR